MDHFKLIEQWEEASGGPGRFARRLAFDRVERSASLEWLSARLVMLPPVVDPPDPARVYEADRPAISAWLGADPGPALSIELLRADAHPGGGPPTLIRSDSGVELVYKSRSMAGEVLWAAACEWFNRSGADLRAAAALDLGTHGYQRYVQPGDSLPEGEEAGRRAGQLIALAWLLGLADLHRDNVIIDGEGYPVPVDLECLLLPPFPVIDGELPGSPLSSAEIAAPGTFLDTGLLDFWIPGPEGLRDQGGLRVANRAQGQALLDRFEWMCRCIRGLRDAFVEDFEPQIEGLRSRLVFRHTAHYLAMIEGVAGREQMQRAALLDGWLSRIYTQQPTPPEVWNWQALEWRALSQGKVPRLRVPADFEPVKARLAGLDARSVQGHARLLSEAVFWEMPADTGQLRTDSLRPLPGAPRETQLPPLPGHPATRAFLSEAARIAERIDTQAYFENGRAAMVARVRDRRSGALRLRRMGWNFYDGLSGVALFLHALDQQNGAEAHATLIEALLADLRDALRQSERAARLGARLPLGLEGLGGLVYAFVRLGDAESAGLAAALISPEKIAGDLSLDWQAGAAGAIAGLLALGDLERAQACGQHLLDCAIETSEGQSCWLTLNRQPHTGFSHGAAGISVALARLAQHSGEERFAQAARAAVAFENSLYNEEARNWPDRRKPGQFGQSWCHGAPGIALARIAVSRALGDDSLLNDLAPGLALARSAPAGQVEHLCCGYAGHIDLLIEAGQYEDAWMLLLQMIMVKGAREYRLFPGRGRDFWSPALFRGIAGIGYTALRLLDPHKHPSVLLMDC